MSFWDDEEKEKGCLKNFHFIIHSLKNHVLNHVLVQLEASK